MLINADVCLYATGSPGEISNHSYQLARLVYTRLLSWRHSNGQCLAELYHGASDFMSSKTQGPIVNFNLLRADGSYVGFTQVNKQTCLAGRLLVGLPTVVINVMFCFEVCGMIKLGMYQISLFQIRPESDLSGFVNSYPAGAGTRAGFENLIQHKTTPQLE